MHILALTDNRAGHTSHTLGLAEALRLKTRGVVQQVPLAYGPLAKLPAPWVGAYAYDSISRARLREGTPDLVVATGRRLRNALLAIKRRHPSCQTVHCFGNPAPGITVSLRPDHDDTLIGDISPLRFRGALHRLSTASLEAALPHFEQTYDTLPAPRIGVLLGGHSRRRQCQPSDIHHILDLAELLHGGKGSLIIAPSRRTPKHADRWAAERITCPYAFWDGEGENPYLAMLAGCDALVVSGDSISMMSEACFTGKPVFIDTRFSTSTPKHRRVAAQLIADGYAAPLTGDSLLDFHPTGRLDEMQRLMPELCLALGL
tara:strand:- start:10003 stop:10953 length:951 start_codon:yes stop_codon:yes gene_type:complete